MSNSQVDRARNVMLALGWQAPFFLVPLASLTFAADAAIPTASVSPKGRVRINPTWAASLPDRQLAGVIAHEVLHLLLGHVARRGSRDHETWNVAADQAINQALRTAGIHLPPGAYYPPAGHEEDTAEALYDLLAAKPPEERPKPQPDQAGQGCAPEPGDGEPEDGAGGDEIGEGQAPNWEEVAAQAQAIGTGSTAGIVRLLTPPPARVTWDRLLRATLARVLASGARDVQTYRRRNRRSPADLILPGWATHRPRVAVAIDTSGSMSDEMVSAAVRETREIGEASGARVFLVLHDTRAYWSGWTHTHRPEDVAHRATRRGGTDFGEAYRRVGEERARFDALIHLTDGEAYGWPPAPGNCRRLVAAIVGDGRYASPPPAGAQRVEVRL